MTAAAPNYLFPQPRRYETIGGTSPRPERFELRAACETAARLAAETRAEERLAAILAAACAGSADQSGDPSSAVALVEYREELHPQGYRLAWGADGLRFAVRTAQGLHYALLTAGQLFEGQRGAAEWAHCAIDDEPDFPVRGAMLDIGRNKIPKMETLRMLVDRLAELKFNHLQLYMEGFCFDYARHSHLFPEATPMTAAEYRELDAYAAARFIDLVPNQNCLGHMGPWLAKPEFRDIAEHPEGMPAPEPLAFKLPPLTMNPVDQRSAELAKALFDELLPNFSSVYVNLNMDEPFGLGTGESRARAEEIGVGALYFEYAERMFEIARGHGKQPMIWGDVLAHHPELMERIPPDVTVLHWNYDAPVAYEPHCRRLREHGVRYYVCPGTSGWLSITGRTDNMLGNIADAARSGLTHGASGLIVADWGDGGHWQTPAVSYPALAYAAGAAWQTEANLDRMEPLEHHVSARMLRDRGGDAARFLMEMGRYYHLERSTMDNRTLAAYLLLQGLSDREKLERDAEVMVQVLKVLGGSGTPFAQDWRYAEMAEWLRQRREELARLDFEPGAESELFRAELANALDLIEQAAGLHRYIFRPDLEEAASESAWVEQLRAQLQRTLAEFKRLWLARNREGGLAASTAAFEKLLGQYEEELQKLR
ncbi:beta-N-acetylhexosaminidase [Paenibacillus methanolicus]|uniref:beta-N-acetylhexosaminidase n=1 Tax=Paenibacillus methanolicus TaxID=582686 RepID=A0A5S5C5J2_9BACL|nr:family 20 glycosylhydrolase [Paenibacillus methanolicus]TYP74604.1 glycosyl hydrolase family 20 [Paenibacillus methanolicus]